MFDSYCKKRQQRKKEEARLKEEVRLREEKELRERENKKQEELKKKEVCFNCKYYIGNLYVGECHYNPPTISKTWIPSKKVYVEGTGGEEYQELGEYWVTNISYVPVNSNNFCGHYKSTIKKRKKKNVNK